MTADPREVAKEEERQTILLSKVRERPASETQHFVYGCKIFEL